MFVELTRYCIACSQQHKLGLYRRNFRRDTVYEFVCPNSQETVYLHISGDKGMVDTVGAATDAIVLCEVALSKQEQVNLVFD
jgi:hypothetical protein